MSLLLRPLVFLYLVPSVVSLFCFTCVFPTISPMDCIKFPQKCLPGQLCLSSKAVAEHGEFIVTLYEKSCVLSSLCGLTGEKDAMGLNFTFTNECCASHLCNGTATTTACYWTGLAFSILLSISLSLC